MTDILEFLEARLVDDEVVVLGMQREAVRVETAPVFQGHPMVDWLTRVDIFVSPDRLLAEVAAKRALIAHITDLSVDPHYADAESYGDCALVRHYGNTGVCDCGRDERVTHRLRIMASVYAGHPDYDPAWTIPQ